MKACVNCEGHDDDCFDPSINPALKREIKAAKKNAVPENYIQRVIQFARQGYTDDRVQDLRHRLGFGGLPHRLRPELQQLGLAQGRFPARRRERRRLEPDPPARTARSTKTLKARDLWEKIGYAAWASADPGLHFNTTMNDWHTCAGRRPDPRVEPVLGIHVPRRHGLQPRLDQPAALPQRRRHDRHRSLRARRPAVDHRARDLGDDGAVPVEGDRRALLRIPHARPRLRQYRRPADDLRHPL